MSDTQNMEQAQEVQHRPYYTHSRYSHQRVEPRKKLLLLTC